MYIYVEKIETNDRYSVEDEPKMKISVAFVSEDEECYQTGSRVTVFIPKNDNLSLNQLKSEAIRAAHTHMSTALEMIEP